MDLEQDAASHLLTKPYNYPKKEELVTHEQLGEALQETENEMFSCIFGERGLKRPNVFWLVEYIDKLAYGCSLEQDAQVAGLILSLIDFAKFRYVYAAGGDGWRLKLRGALGWGNNLYHLEDFEIHEGKESTQFDCVVIGKTDIVNLCIASKKMVSELGLGAFETSLLHQEKLLRKILPGNIPICTMVVPIEKDLELDGNSIYRVVRTNMNNALIDLAGEPQDENDLVFSPTQIAAFEKIAQPTKRPMTIDIAALLQTFATVIERIDERTINAKNSVVSSIDINEVERM